MEAFIFLLVVFGFWPLALALDVCLQKSKTKGLPLHKIDRCIKLFLTIGRSVTTLIEILIKLRRTVTRNTQGLPLRGTKMLRQKNDLPDVIRVMHQLPVNRRD